MNKIPKIIHYCWFGNEEPDTIKENIRKWENLLPDFEIMRWTQDNFNLNDCRFAKQAFDAKKYAFVSDYVRLAVLRKYGGIYLDTDVEVLKNFDSLLKNDIFFGFETDSRVGTSTIGATKNHPIIDLFIDYYENSSFFLSDGRYNLTPNTEIISQILLSYGFNLNGDIQEINGCKLFSQEFFCPFNPERIETYFTDNTYCIHQFDASWKKYKSLKEIKIERQIKIFQSLFGKRLGKRICLKLRKIYFEIFKYKLDKE